MTLEEILALASPTDQVTELKKRTNSPDITTISKQYDPAGHDIMDISKRPDKQIKDENGNITRTETVGRVALALQKLIVKRAVAFLFGNPVKYQAKAEAPSQKMLYEAVKAIQAKVKINSFNRKLAKEMFKSTEAAEYWYPVEEQNEFYGFPSKFKMRVSLFSPLDGDSLYPLFDALGDLVAFSRGYVVKEGEKDVNYLDTWTVDTYYQFKEEQGGWVVAQTVKSVLGKIPIIYGSQDTTEWSDVQALINRLEKLLSNFADTNDYHASPKIFVTGTITGFSQKGESGAIIEGEDGATAEYLSWQNAPESVKLEISNLLNMIYTISQTPDISFESLKGVGAVSGVALKLMFLDAHLKVQEKLEIFDEYLQRRVNLIKAFCAQMNTSLAKDLLLEIVPEVTPFMVDDFKTMVETLVTANGNKPIMSQKTSVEMSGLVDDVEAEVAQINSEEQATATLDIGAPTI